MGKLEKLLNAEDVAELLGIGKLTVYGMVARKQIPFVKLSRRMLRFRESEIAEWVELKSKRGVGTGSRNIR